MAKFRTKARAVDLLGKQQVRDEVTAITELLRNAYDADADEGLVSVDTNSKEIIIWDDGEGMSREDIEEKWLTLGTYSKVNKQTRKTAKGRIKIGEKGIGRLAISTLGDQNLMLSKDGKTGIWTLLYLHWDLFRNEQMYLEDINLPIMTFSTLNDLRYFLNNNLTELKGMLLENLSDYTKWSKEGYEKVFYEVSNFMIEPIVFNYLNRNEKKGQGTLFYVKNLDAAWDWTIYKNNYNSTGTHYEHRKRRLRDTLSNFKNIFDIYVSPEVKDQNSFLPRIHINGEELENTVQFNQDDLNLYDYGLIGKIENGIFEGTAVINTLEGKKEFSINESMTTGINNPTTIDCGPIDVKWYFVEGEKYNSALPKEQHDKILDKLNDVGGIYVFRDGLRILPYGEEDNDFLYIEKNRTKRAGTYLFSYRRMFGYLGISKETNPQLVDKSSREGFVENSQYLYFQKTLMNLLDWWAKDFLETKYKKNGKRSLRNEAIKSIKKAEEISQQIKKAEEQKEKEYFIKLNKQIATFEPNLFSKITELNKNTNYLIEKNLYLLKESNTITNLTNLHLSLIHELNLLTTKFEKDLIIEISNRYDHSFELIENINHLNYRIQEEILKIQSDYQGSLFNIVKELENKLKNDPPKNEDEEVKSINEKINRIALNFDTIISTKFNSLESTSNSEFNSYKNQICSAIDEINTNFKKNTVQKTFNLEDIIHVKMQKINLLQDRLNSLERFYSSEDIINSIKVAINDLEQDMKNLQLEINDYSKEVLSSNELKQIFNLLKNIHKKLDTNNLYSVEDEDYLIGLLKKEVNMYRDISAVGLAAELTSHEFNSLYQQIKKNLVLLNKGLAQTKLRPTVESTTHALLSLERLHQRMSPLYRQSRMRKNEFSLKEFINSTCEYFASEIQRYDIKIINDVPENYKIKETESILFTPIINLISNSIYWLMNCERKEIHFYLDSNNNLYVHDTGPGINSSHIDQLFEPYFSRKSNGRGLGLYLSKDILKSRGHNISYIMPEYALKSLNGACFAIMFNEKMEEGFSGNS